MHSVARIAYRGDIDNIQVSWVKMGVEGARQVLQAGANDVGGTLMDENISRAAGASRAAHGRRGARVHGGPAGSAAGAALDAVRAGGNCIDAVTGDDLEYGGNSPEAHAHEIEDALPDAQGTRCTRRSRDWPRALARAGADPGAAGDDRNAE